MVSITYKNNDSHKKVTIIKNNGKIRINFKQAKALLLQAYRYITENNSLSFYLKWDPENLSEFFK